MKEALPGRRFSQGYEWGLLALKSMTGFGAAGQENEDYKVHVEVKAVNQRYLDISFSMPRALNVFENDMRQTIKKFCARGKVDVNIIFHDKREKEATIAVDKSLARAYQTALYELGDRLGTRLGAVRCHAPKGRRAYAPRLRTTPRLSR